MAVGFTNRGTAGATGTTATSVSITPNANARAFVIAGARQAGATLPVITDSLGGTWTLVPGADVKFGAVYAALYYQDVGASPAARTHTITSTGATHLGMGMFEVTGHSADLSNFASGTNNAGDPTATLPSAPAATSFGLAMAVLNAGGTPTGFPAGYSQVIQTQPATNLRICLFTDATSAGAVQSWVSPATDSIAFGLEIKEFVAVGAGSALKVWNGSAWVEKPSKVWDGSAWVAKPLKVWNGSAWV